MGPVSMAESSDWEMSVFQVFNQSPCDPRHGSLCARTDVSATFMMDKITCVEGGPRLLFSSALSEKFLELNKILILY